MIPEGQRLEFLQEAYFTNYYRARIFSVAIFLIHLFLLYVDLQHKAAGQWVTTSGYLYLFYLHLILEAVLLFFIILMTISKPASAADVRISNIITAVLFMLFILVWELIPVFG